MSQTAIEQAVSVIDFTIGENVDLLRKRAGMTKAELGVYFGIGGPAMSLKISGKRAWSAADVQFAARLFGVRVAQFYGEEPMPEPTTPATVIDIAPRLRDRPKSRPNHYRVATEGVVIEGPWANSKIA